MDTNSTEHQQNENESIEVVDMTTAPPVEWGRTLMWSADVVEYLLQCDLDFNEVRSAHFGAGGKEYVQLVDHDDCIFSVLEVWKDDNGRHFCELDCERFNELTVALALFARRLGGEVPS